MVDTRPDGANWKNNRVFETGIAPRENGVFLYFALGIYSCLLCWGTG